MNTSKPIETADMRCHQQEWPLDIKQPVHERVLNFLAINQTQNNQQTLNEQEPEAIKSALIKRP